MSRQTPRRSVFRPCIDLHNGFVKQIVGGTLSDNPEDLKTNFVATYVAQPRRQHRLLTLNFALPASWPVNNNATLQYSSDSAASFARLYRMNHLEGGHIIKLGPGNDEAAREALKAWPGMYT